MPPKLACDKLVSAVRGIGKYGVGSSVRSGAAIQTGHRLSAGTSQCEAAQHQRGSLFSISVSWLVMTSPPLDGWRECVQEASSPQFVRASCGCELRPTLAA